MTLRELVERVERESLHPTTMDLPLSLVRPREDRLVDKEYEVVSIRVDSQHGVVLSIVPVGWLPQ